MPRVRVLHYLNQFFAGIGGEDKAGMPLDYRKGALGPGKRLQTLLGDSAEIVVTAYCGDNYFSEHTDTVVQAIAEIAKSRDVNIVVAGPAFSAGRYGFACAEVCHCLAKSAGLSCVSGMFAENPGVDSYQQYKDNNVFLLPTSDAVTGMEDALLRIADFTAKLARGSKIGSPAEEGYIARGYRVIEIKSKNGADRAIDMLLNKIAARPFSTEIPVENLEPITVPPRVSNLKNACLALVSTSGVVPKGNPDGFKGNRNTQWKKYSIEKLDSMKRGEWEVMHGGYNTQFIKDNPNYGVPLDVFRKLESEGVFGRTHSYFYATTGSGGLISAMQTIGREIVSDMKVAGVSSALLVST
ncbi:MAG: glycine/betaine/sarcosine/D-proline family reductase selenoprotein B [Deltaproteobacteria bacterium]|nr:glycine/betaine/sarcosine/D-proline family reductase selenoprotein B [Deltaproteobacteria bacterium]